MAFPTELAGGAKIYVDALSEEPGTLGLLYRSGNKFYGLTACHVVSDERTAHPTEVYLDRGLGGVRIGKVLLGKLGPDTDLALIELDEAPIRWSSVRGYSNVSARWGLPSPGREVFKVGAATEKTSGALVGPTTYAQTHYLATGTASVFHSSALKIEPLAGAVGAISEGGDSGAVWVDAVTFLPVALHIGGNGDYAYALSLDSMIEG